MLEWRPIRTARRPRATEFASDAAQKATMTTSKRPGRVHFWRTSPPAPEAPNSLELARLAVHVHS